MDAPNSCNNVDKPATPQPYPSPTNKRSLCTILSSSMELPNYQQSESSSLADHHLAMDVLTSFPDQSLMHGIDGILHTLLSFSGGDASKLGDEDEEITELFTSKNSMASEVSSIGRMGSVSDVQISEPIESIQVSVHKLEPVNNVAQQSLSNSTVTDPTPPTEELCASIKFEKEEPPIQKSSSNPLSRTSKSPSNGGESHKSSKDKSSSIEDPSCQGDGSRRLRLGSFINILIVDIIQNRSDVELRDVQHHPIRRSSTTESKHLSSTGNSPLSISPSKLQRIESDVMTQLRNSTYLHINSQSVVQQTTPDTKSANQKSASAIILDRSGNLMINASILGTLIHRKLDDVITAAGTKAKKKRRELRPLMQVVQNAIRERILARSDMLLMANDMKFEEENMQKINHFSRILEKNSTKGDKNKFMFTAKDIDKLESLIVKVLSNNSKFSFSANTMVYQTETLNSHSKAVVMETDGVFIIDSTFLARIVDEALNDVAGQDSRINRVPTPWPQSPPSQDSLAKRVSFDGADHPTPHVGYKPHKGKPTIFSARRQEKLPKPKPKLTEQRYAITRINKFDDTSMTYEVMKPLDRDPKSFLSEVEWAQSDRPDVFFAVLPDRTTVCYAAF